MDDTSETVEGGLVERVKTDVTHAVHEQRLVTQLSVGAVKRCPLALLASNAPQLHYRVEEAQRSFRRENMAAIEASEAAVAVVPTDKSSGDLPLLTEARVLGALECTPPGVEISSFNRPQGDGRMGEDLSEENLAAQVAAAKEAAEAATAAMSLCTLQGLRGVRALAAALAFVDNSTALAAPPAPPLLTLDATISAEMKPSSPSNGQLTNGSTALTVATPLTPNEGSSSLARPPRFLEDGSVHPATAAAGEAARVAAAAAKELALERVRTLLSTAAVHLDLHRLGPRHQLRLKFGVLGGPGNGNDGALGVRAPTEKGQAVPLLSGARCVFGVAPAVGVVVNHPLLKGPRSNTEVNSHDGNGAKVHSKASSRSDGRDLGNSNSTSSDTYTKGSDKEGVESVALAVLWGTGGTLHDRLLRGERVTNNMVEKWMAGCAACLMALHARGLCLGKLDTKGVSLFPPVSNDPGGAMAKRRAAKAAKKAAAEAAAAAASAAVGGRGARPKGTPNNKSSSNGRDVHVPSGPPRAARVAVPEAKVHDLSRVGLLPLNDVLKTGGAAATNPARPGSSPSKAEGTFAAAMSPSSPVSPSSSSVTTAANNTSSSAQMVSSFMSGTYRGHETEAQPCVWTLRELVWTENALPPGYADLDDDDGARGVFEEGPSGITAGALSPGEVRPRRSSSHDVWYLGCLGLELTARASLAGWPHGRVSRLSRHQVENIIAPRFGDTLRTVISGCLLRDPSARLSASACLDLLSPKEAARLRGESVRGWLKRNPKPPKRILSVPSTGSDDDEESDMDTSSGSEPENTGSRGKDKAWDNGEQNDDDEEEDDHFDGMRWRRKRYGVKEAVARAERRVRLFQRAEWWRQLDEPSRRDRLRRRRCRVEARARFAFLRGCMTLSRFKDWNGHELAEWLSRVAAAAALAKLLDPFTVELSDDERLARLINGSAGDSDKNGKKEDDGKDGNGKSGEKGNGKGDAAKRPEGAPDSVKEPVLGFIEQIQLRARPYDLTPPAARFGRIWPATGLKAYRTGCAGALGQSEEDDAANDRAARAALGKLGAAKTKELANSAAATAATQLTLAISNEISPDTREREMVEYPPLASEYSDHPYVKGIVRACLEWKADGYVVWAAVSDARKAAAEEMTELMQTTFRYEDSAVIAARDQWIQVRCLVEQEALKPIFERTVSAAEPQLPPAPQQLRACWMLAVGLHAAFDDAMSGGEVGRHFAASLIQAQARGVSTRQVLRDVWLEAAARARADMAAQEAQDAARRAKRRAAMAERLEAQVSLRNMNSNTASNHNSASTGSGLGLGLGGFGAPVIDPMDTFAPVLVAEPVLPPSSSSMPSSSLLSMASSSQASMSKHNHYRDLGSRSLVLGLPDLIADAAWSLGRQNRMFTLTATLVEDYSSNILPMPGDGSAVADAATIDIGDRGVHQKSSREVAPPIASDGSQVAGLIEVAISDAPIKASKASKMAQTSAERHAAAALDAYRVYGAAPGSDVYGVRRSGSTVILSGLKPDAVYRVRFAIPQQEQAPHPGASSGQTAARKKASLDPVAESLSSTDEDEVVTAGGLSKAILYEAKDAYNVKEEVRSEPSFAALALAAENPEWVEGEPPTVEVRTQPCTPDPPPNLTVAVAYVSPPGAPTQGRNAKESAAFQASKSRSSRNNSGISSSSSSSSSASNKDGLRPVCHITWSAPTDNGWPVDLYRVQRRLRCTVALPAPDQGVHSSDNDDDDHSSSSSGGQGEGVQEWPRKRVSVKVLQELEGQWATVHEGTSIGWSDRMPSQADKNASKCSSSNHSNGTAAGKSSDMKGSNTKTKGVNSSPSLATAEASASRLLSEQVAELNQLSSVHAEQHAQHLAHVAEVVRAAVDPEQNSNAITQVEPGVNTVACYRVAARNRLGWGAYSAPVRGRLGGGLTGLQVTVADGDAWAAALEGTGAHIYRPNAAASSKEAFHLGCSLSSTTLPHQLTEGIFHNYSAAASESVAGSAGSSNTKKDRGLSTTPVARAVSQAPDRGLPRPVVMRGAVGSSASNPSGIQKGGATGRGRETGGLKRGPTEKPTRAVTLGRVQDEDKRRLPAAAHSRRPSAASTASGSGFKRRPLFDETLVADNCVLQPPLGNVERHRKTLALLGVRQTAAEVPASMENSSGDALGSSDQEELELYLNGISASDEGNLVE